MGAVAVIRRDEGPEWKDDLYIQTVALAYTRQHGLPLGRRNRPFVAWYGDMDMAGHIWGLLKRGPLDVQIKISEPIPIDSFEDRKQLALFSELRVRDDVAGLLSPRP